MAYTSAHHWVFIKGEYNMQPRNHPLFKQFPLQNKVHISTGEVPTPYLIYDGFGLFIGGAGDYDAVKQLLQHEDVFPIKTRENKALMGIWVCNFTDASLGPHHELQFSFFVHSREAAPLPDHPFNALQAFASPDVQMLCFGLWNNTPNVVAYNRELLSLNARQTNSEVQRNGDRVNFKFEDASTQTPVLAGSVKTTFSFSVLTSFLRKLGFRRGSALMSQPWASMEVVNPKGVILERNAVAKAFDKNASNALHLFDSADEIKIQDPVYAALNFVPHVVQFMDGFKFVYLQPE